MSKRPDLPRVTILLCTCDGARHLDEQLDSYLAQYHRDWDLWVSDDGSRDATRDILQRFRIAQAGRHHVRLVDGPRRGPAANYLSLLCHPDLPPGPVALSDQDDVWLPGKLSRGLRCLGDASGPALYGAQSFHADADLQVVGGSVVPPMQPSFVNAVVQNVVSGHSAMLNTEALALLRSAGAPPGVPYHDWWLYQLITGAGGRVMIDSRRVLLYRQHGRNAMGAHQGLRATLRRARQLMGRTYGGWIAANLDALETNANLLTPEARTIVTALRDPGTARAGPARVRLLRQLGLQRQSRVAQAALLAAGFLGRI